jgi:hypothetical protein
MSQPRENPHSDGTPYIHKAVNHVADGMTAFDAYHAAPPKPAAVPISSFDDAYEAVDAEGLPLKTATEE